MAKNKSKKVNEILKQETKEILKENKKIVETRTIEELLKDLRTKKDWPYWNLVEELSKRNIMIDEKRVKKWEYGLEYPDLDTIYRLSEIYEIPSENFVIAKNNSFKEGFETIHMEFIKRFCYITGISLKIGYIAMYVVIGLALVGALLFFISKCNEYLLVRSMMN